MPNFNKVMLMGNLTRDIELRYTSGDTAVAAVGLAVNRKWRDKSGETKDEVTFVDCEAWGKTAEAMAQYLKKGRPVFIEGRLKLEQWEDKNSGAMRSKIKVVIESFQFIDSRDGGGSDSGGGGGARTASHAPAGKRATKQRDTYLHEPIDEDDIPF